MNKLIFYSALLLTVIACKPVPSEYDEYYGAGFISVDEALWPTEYATPYPFTVPYGEISCTSHPKFGREVYFAPKSFTDESYIGTPLNKATAEALKRYSDIPNVPYSIKKGADLSEAIQIGLKLCDEQQNFIDNGG